MVSRTIYSSSVIEVPVFKVLAISDGLGNYGNVLSVGEFLTSAKADSYLTTIKTEAGITSGTAVTALRSVKTAKVMHRVSQRATSITPAEVVVYQIIALTEVSGSAGSVSLIGEYLNKANADADLTDINAAATWSALRKFTAKVIKTIKIVG